MSSSSDASIKRASQPPLEHLQGIVERATTMLRILATP
jgi:hypothetical protein